MQNSRRRIVAIVDKDGIDWSPSVESVDRVLDSGPHPLAKPVHPLAWLDYSRGRAVRKEGLTSYGLAWFASEEEAEECGRLVREARHVRNGGLCHGSGLGNRMPGQDCIEDGRKLYAVTTP